MGPGPRISVFNSFSARCSLHDNNDGWMLDIWTAQQLGLPHHLSHMKTHTAREERIKPVGCGRLYSPCYSELYCLSSEKVNLNFDILGEMQQ
jgi:hypothetical protein